MSALPKRWFTVEEYLTLEGPAEYKSQYVAGEIYSMAGTQPEHVEVKDNLTYLFRLLFRGRPCRSYSSDLRVGTRVGELYTYPDLTVLCGKPQFEKYAGLRTLLNPQVIFEILSPSTGSFDRDEKFARYQRMPTLTDYVLVTADAMRVEHYERQTAGGWLYREHRAPEDRLRLASVEAELALADIYDRVEFASPEG